MKIQARFAGLIFISVFIISLAGCGGQGTRSSGSNEGDRYLNAGIQKLSEKKYDDAVRYFYKVAEIDKGDSRASYGVARCTLEKYKFLLSGAQSADGGEKNTIVKVYGDFVAMLEKKDWKGITGSVSALSVLHGSGTLVTDDASLRTSLDAYLGLITSATMNIYLKSLAVDGVRVKGNVAEVKLKMAGGSATDEVYLIRDKGRWKIALFTGSIVTGGAK
ncbi:MAG: nuclear transport factor 2 family protein [Spirochaetes bacterium]|jgi:hypothetical protein|nr:nuclear transport factor 2 family protein [Spirochaetota bacterium]